MKGRVEKMVKRALVLCCLSAAVVLATSAEPAAGSGDKVAVGWMRGKVGVFCHFLPDAATFPRLGEFDVKGLVSDLKRMKIDCPGGRIPEAQVEQFARVLKARGTGAAMAAAAGGAERGAACCQARHASANE